MIDQALRASLAAKYGYEQIYVMPFSSLTEVPDRFSSIVPKKIARGGLYMRRSDAEYNMSVVQPIPYILVVNSDEDKIYVTKRIAGEERLKDSLSLGCGGHVNPCDAGANLLINAALREMNEELELELINKLKIIGTVRDLRSPTAEHLGVVMIAKSDNVSIKESKNLEGQWMSFLDLVANYSKFESWARILIDEMLIRGKNINSLYRTGKQ